MAVYNSCFIVIIILLETDCIIIIYTNLISICLHLLPEKFIFIFFWESGFITIYNCLIAFNSLIYLILFMYLCSVPVAQW